jgi:hypothetical protein
MRSLRSAFAVATAACVLASGCAVALASASRGEVGGPPTVKLGPPDEGIQISPALVIGVGSMLGRRTELVAYGWRAESDSPPADFCVWAMPLSLFPEFGTCDRALPPERAISIDMQIQAISPKRARATTVGGRITPEVAAVRVYFRRPGGKRRRQVNALVGQVSGTLQRRLEQPAPFGFFYARVRGLVPSRDFKAQALDSSGNVIETAGPYAVPITVPFDR